MGLEAARMLREIAFKSCSKFSGFGSFLLAKCCKRRHIKAVACQVALRPSLDELLKQRLGGIHAVGAKLRVRPLIQDVLGNFRIARAGMERFENGGCFVLLIESLEAERLPIRRRGSLRFRLRGGVESNDGVGEFLSFVVRVTGDQSPLRQTRTLRKQPLQFLE